MYIELYLERKITPPPPTHLTRVIALRIYMSGHLHPGHGHTVLQSWAGEYGLASRQRNRATGTRKNLKNLKVSVC